MLGGSVNITTRLQCLTSTLTSSLVKLVDRYSYLFITFYCFCVILKCKWILVFIENFDFLIRYKMRYLLLTILCTDGYKDQLCDLPFYLSWLLQTALTNPVGLVTSHYHARRNSLVKCLSEFLTYPTNRRVERYISLHTFQIRSLPLCVPRWPSFIVGNCVWA